jgi:L-galactono-1,4-lactone dehydrogenase
MKQLLQDIEAADIPAHSPIEQRWTSSSSAPMSPASHTQGTSSSGSSAVQIAADSVHSWVGIIMYLPTEVAAERKAITDR